MVRKAADALVAKISALPGGQFSLILKSLSDVRNDTIVFLGHAIEMVEGVVNASPAYPDDLFEPLSDQDDRLALRVFGIKPLLSPLEKQHSVALLGDMWVLAKSWGAAFKACDDVEDWLSVVSVGLEPYLKPLGCTWEQLEAYRNKHAKWNRHYIS